MKTRSNPSWLRSGFYIAPLAVATACMPAMLSAATLSLLPAVQDVSIGNSFDLSVQIADLGDLSAPSLGTFDLNLLFNPALVQFDSISFGDQLGLPLDVINTATPGVGSLNAFSVSLLDPLDLDSFQAGEFTLASVHFTALAAGTGDFSLANIILGDSFGVPLPLDGISGAVVNIGPQGVPDNTAFWATAFAFGALAFVHRKSAVQRTLV